MVDSYVNRTMEKTLKKSIGERPIIMVTGPRQVGKTTLLNFLTISSKKKINYVSLDDIMVRTMAQDDPELFLRTYDTPLVIDEFQYAPKLLSYIKIRVDEARQNEMFGDGKKCGTLYYLTGSQIFQTMEDVSESLAGRVGIYQLFALSRREMAKEKEEIFLPDIKSLKKKHPLEKNTTKKIFDIIFKGSYPEVYANKKISVENFYSDYVRTYIERDVRKLINISEEAKFVKFLSVVAARTGLEFNAQQIGLEIGVSGKTIDKWISILKNTGLIYMLQPYSNNNISRIVKRPKIYFMDTGLACYLTGYIDSVTLEKSVFSGQIFETYLISEIIKSYVNNGIDPRFRLYYYRDNNQKEIDLLIKNGDIIYPVEIKKNANPGRDAFKNFSVCDKFGMKVGTGVVLCLCREIIPNDEVNYYVPIEYI